MTVVESAQLSEVLARSTAARHCGGRWRARQSCQRGHDPHPFVQGQASSSHSRWVGGPCSMPWRSATFQRTRLVSASFSPGAVWQALATAELYWQHPAGTLESRNQQTSNQATDHTLCVAVDPARALFLQSRLASHCRPNELFQRALPRAQKADGSQSPSSSSALTALAP